MPFLKSSARRRFSATIVATVAALALMTAAAVPARAGSDRDDPTDAIVALTGMAMLAAGVNRHKNDPAPQHVYQPRRKQPHWQRATHPTVLPAHCAMTLRRHRQKEVVYPAHCLRRAGIGRRLPQRCEVSLRGKGHGRTAYEQTCLLKSGFRTQGRHRH